MQHFPTHSQIVPFADYIAADLAFAEAVARHAREAAQRGDKIEADYWRDKLQNIFDRVDKMYSSYQQKI